MTDYLVALAITVGVEVPLWTALTDGPSAQRRALIGLGANLLTHGTLWSVWTFVPLGYAWKLVVLETLVWLAEAGLCVRFGLLPWSRALTLSLVCNALTVLIGLWQQA